MNCGSGEAAVVSPVDLEGEGGFTALFVGHHHRLRRGVALAEDDLLVCVRVCVCVCVYVCVCLSSAVCGVWCAMCEAKRVRARKGGGGAQ